MSDFLTIEFPDRNLHSMTVDSDFGKLAGEETIEVEFELIPPSLYGGCPHGDSAFLFLTPDQAFALANHLADALDRLQQRKEAALRDAETPSP